MSLSAYQKTMRTILRFATLLMLIFFVPQTICAEENGDFARLRKRMVKEQIIARGVKDPGVIRAMEQVPRHLFVPEAYWKE